MDFQQVLQRQWWEVMQFNKRFHFVLSEKTANERGSSKRRYRLLSDNSVSYCAPTTSINFCCNFVILSFSLAISFCNLAFCFSQFKIFLRHFSLFATFKQVVMDSAALNFEASNSALISAFSFSSLGRATLATSAWLFRWKSLPNGDPSFKMWRSKFWEDRLNAFEVVDSN